MRASGSVAGEAPSKRRRRSKQERRQIVEETLGPGASVARVARAHDVNANQVFYWRRLYREGRLDSAAEATTALVPVRITGSVTCQPGAPEASAPGSGGPGGRRTKACGTIQVEMGRARMRIDGAPDPAALRIVLECLLG